MYICIYVYMYICIYVYMYICTSLLPSIPSTMKFRGNEAQLQTKAVLEVHLKLRSHSQLFWKFKWQY